MKRPIGVTLLGAFFAAGTLICLLSCVTLAWPGGGLEAIWRVDPAKREAFAKMGYWAILLLAAVGAACAATAVGLWRGARWGRRLALVMLAVNGLGDAVHGLHDPRSLVGVPIAALLIGYLLVAGRQARSRAAGRG
jgi:hypothetical protein